MKYNRIICFALCFALLLCCTACRKTDSSYSDTSSATVITGSETVDSAPSNSQTIIYIPSTESSVPNTSDQNSSVTEPSGHEVYKIDFDKIDTVDYFCVKNIPNSDIVYAVTGITANTKDDITLGCQLFCNDSNVKIKSQTITIPYSYKQQNKPVTITAKYSFTGQSKDFTIKYYDDWKMVWEDQFDGNQINFAKWDYRPDWLRDKGYVNYWDRSTMFVDGKGNLVSRATPGKKVVHGKEIDAYLSGAISTKGLFESTYGYYEARVKLHHQTGMWGAFWLICGDMDSGTPADDNLSINGCEIDVFESIFPEGGVAHNLHWDGFTGHTSSAPSTGFVTQINTYDNQYHDFAISWTPNEYVFLIDGIVTRRINAKTAGGICNQPGYMIISTECGPWAGKWVLGEGEYSDMLVDYVRVYQNSFGIYK